MNRIEESEQALWEEQIDRDSSTGRLDFLFEEAGRESVQGLLREWPGGYTVYRLL
jgi:hypothetical protein